MILKPLFCISGILALACMAKLQAQPADSAKLLSEVIVKGSRLNRYAIAQYTLPADSITNVLATGGSLSELLQKHGFGHVRAYGPGGLAGATFRGTGSNHTAVLWNGINLTSPLSGQIDFSLLPMGFIDNVSVQTGGTASLFGNGTIGGVIHLNDKVVWNKGLTAQADGSIGSFENMYKKLAFGWHGKKIISTVKLLTHTTKNDFEFLNQNVFPARVERRAHTAMSQKALLQQNYWQVSSRHFLSLHLWLQDNAYEVPNPVFIVTKPQAVEKNQFYRVVAGWNYVYKNATTHYQSALIRHHLNYTEQEAAPSSQSISNSWTNSAEGNWTLGHNMDITAGINYTQENVQVDAFGGDIPNRNRWAFFGAFKIQPITWLDISVSLRRETTNKQPAQYAPSLITKVTIQKGLSIYNTLSRSYRIPTFNDLYWKSAGAIGNPNLKPEVSASGDMGLQWEYPFRSNQQSITLKTAIFSNQVNDWVLWGTTSNQVWMPQNIKKVWSRGIEAQIHSTVLISQLKLQLSGQYSFTKATNEAVYEKTHLGDVGKQLMLTPQHEGSVTIRASWKGYMINWTHTYTGKQYMNSDNSDFYPLQPYLISTAWLAQSIHTKTVTFLISGEVSNLFDIRYESRPNYPMPGRNYKLTVSINSN